MPGDILEKSLSVKIDSTVERGRRRSERVALRIPLKMTARLAGSQVRAAYQAIVPIAMSS